MTPPPRLLPLRLLVRALAACALLGAPAAHGQNVAFAEPPWSAPAAWPEDRPPQPSERYEPPRERSAVRLTLGPQTTVSKDGAHFGALVGLDVGKQRLGGRFSASWARGLSTPGSGASVSQFGGELTLDALRHGWIRPVFGLGVVVLYVEDGAAVSEVKAFAGAGTLRGGVEVPIPLQEADLRLGLAAQGGLIGPADERLERMRGLVNVMASVSLGF